MTFPDWMSVLGLAALGVLIVLLSRRALETFSRWFDHWRRHVRVARHVPRRRRRRL